MLIRGNSREIKTKWIWVVEYLHYFNFPWTYGWVTQSMHRTRKLARQAKEETHDPDLARVRKYVPVEEE